MGRTEACSVHDVAYVVGVAAAASAGVGGATQSLEKIEKAAEPSPGQQPYVANDFWPSW